MRSWSDGKHNIIEGRGGLTLINATLDALPTYILTLFPMPAGALQRLDKLQRNFFGKETRNGKLESSDHRRKTRRFNHQKLQEPNQGSKANMVVEICS